MRLVIPQYQVISHVENLETIKAASAAFIVFLLLGGQDPFV